MTHITWVVITPKWVTIKEITIKLITCLDHVIFVKEEFIDDGRFPSCLEVTLSRECSEYMSLYLTSRVKSPKSSYDLGIKGGTRFCKTSKSWYISVCLLVRSVNEEMKD